jgi:hypothetical protein
MAKTRFFDHPVLIKRRNIVGCSLTSSSCLFTRSR